MRAAWRSKKYWYILPHSKAFAKVIPLKRELKVDWEPRILHAALRSIKHWYIIPHGNAFAKVIPLKRELKVDWEQRIMHAALRSIKYCCRLPHSTAFAKVTPSKREHDSRLNLMCYQVTHCSSQIYDLIKYCKRLILVTHSANSPHMSLTVWLLVIRWLINK